MRWRTRLAAPNHGCSHRAAPPVRVVVPREIVSTPRKRAAGHFSFGYW